MFMVVPFPVTIPHKHLHEMSGIGLGICCPMGEITVSLSTWMFFTSTFCDVGCYMYVCVCVCISEINTEICSFTSTGLLQFCINAVICKWHALETKSVLSGSASSDVGLFVFPTNTNANHKD